MTNKIFNMVRFTPTSRDHVQRIKIILNLKQSTIDLNNNRLTLLIVATICIPIIDIFSEIPLTLVDQQLLKSIQSIWSIFLPKMMMILPPEESEQFFSRRTFHAQPRT